MIFFNQELWATAGAVNENWNYTFNPNGIYRFKGDQWSGINLYTYSQIDSLLDFISVAAIKFPVIFMQVLLVVDCWRSKRIIRSVSISNSLPCSPPSVILVLTG